MITRLLQEVEEVLSGDKLKDEQEERPRLECTMQSDDVWVGWERLMDISLFFTIAISLWG